MTSIKPISVPPKTLSESITASSTSFKSSDILGWDGIALTSSDFGSVAYGIFHNSTKTIIEIFEFDPSTIASASISFIRRGLKFDGDLTTEVTANKLTGVKGDTRVLLGSTVPQLLKSYVDIYGDQTIDGTKTFTAAPRTTTDPVHDNDLTRKSYVLSLVLGTLTTINVIIPGTAGETIAAGELVYFDDTDNEWKKCDADVSTTVENVLLGIAQGAGTNGNAIANGILLQGVDDNQSGLTEGQIYYASNTAGVISSTPGTKEVTIGIGKSATELYFSPRFNQIITEDIQDALDGTSGTPPSSLNKFVDAADVSNSGASGKIVRLTGTSYPAADGANITGIVGRTKVSQSASAVTITNTTSETALASFTVPANTLGTNGSIFVRIFISDFDITTEQLTLRFKYGSTTMATINISGVSSPTNGMGYIDFVLIADASTSAQKGYASTIISTGENFLPSAGITNTSHKFSNGTAAENSTSDLTLAITGQWNVSSSSLSITSGGYVANKVV